MNAATASSLKGARVLIVEDEFFLADDLARGLREAGAEPIGPVSSVKQAEDIVLDEQLDAAIVDLNLHGDMACEFVERLAAIRLPCLIVSGYGADAVPQSVSGVRRLEKPVSPAFVLECLAGELERAV